MTLTRRLGRAGVLAGLLAGTLALAACLPSVEQVAPDDSVPWPGGGPLPAISGGSLEAVYSQEVEWTDCGGLECATIRVPLDWTDPSGPTVALALNRSQARLTEERIGSLLINPGGPGGSGTEFVGDQAYGFLSMASDSILDHYDVVGFDPRGTGLSTPISCGTNEELNAYFLSDDIITTEAELIAARQRTTDFAERCRELTGPLIENVDTASVARDMDLIRAVLGDDKLNFFGFSYGTQLGATYATLFPENVGRMILDGAVDFLLPSEELSLGQAGGFEQALEAYIADCITSEDCPLPRDPDLAKRTVQGIMDTAREEGIPTDRDDLNGAGLIFGLVAPLYSEDGWPFLTQAIQEVLDRGTGRVFLWLADFYLERDENGEYYTNTQEAFAVISCLDAHPGPQMTITEFRAFQRVAEAESPTFGWWFGAGAGCEGWPWTAKEIVDDLSPSATAGPIVVIGTTGDPATPIEWAESLAEQMPSASLIVFTGEGHTAYGQSSSCIVDAVDAYFIDGTVPASGKAC